MTIEHSIPTTTRRPGNYHELDTTSSSQGLQPLENRVLLAGIMNPAGASAIADAFVQVFEESVADALFGVGSEIALMARKALEVGRRIGFQPEIWATPVAEPAGTAAIHKLAVAAGLADAADDIVFRIGEELFRASVSAGDDQDAVALAMKAVVDAKLTKVPVTAAINGVNANEVDLTQNFKGVNGNDLKIIVDSVGQTGLTITPSTPTPGVGSSVLTTALDNSLAKFFETLAIANHLAADVTALDVHHAAAWAPGAKRWVFSFVGENGTLATCNALALPADYRQQFISYEESGSTPGQLATALAVMVSAHEQPNANWDGFELPLGYPPDSAVYSHPEQESALAGGSTPIVPNDARDKALCVRMVTADSTLENLKDLAILRGFVYVIRQLDAAWESKFKGLLKSDKVIRRMRSVALVVLLELEERNIVKNVEKLFPLLIIEPDQAVSTRAVASIPESIVPNLHQSVIKHVLYVE